MTFQGSIKGHANALSGSFSFILAAEQNNFEEKGAFNFWTIVFSWSFLYHLFIPSRPTGPQNFKLDASFLL